MELTGYYPGAIGQLTELHAVYYNQHWGFDLSFESQVARELGQFLAGFDPKRDLFLTAREGERLAGAIAIDGNQSPQARLRWFIVAPSFQGQGLGRRLMAEALAHCRKAGLSPIYLWTFEGLDPARALYEQVGFRLVEEKPGEKWGAAPKEQRFELTL